MQKILGWIPARSNSKGVPAKNKRILAGEPLIVRAIRTAQAARCLDRIVVSTDDPEIAELANAAGAEVPWMRPDELATDDSPVIESAIYDLERLGEELRYCPEALMVLQATSPFRTAGTIRAACEMFLLAGGESVAAVKTVREHPYWCRRVADDGTLEPFVSGAVASRRQALPSAFCLTGVFFLASRQTILDRRSLYSPRTRAFLIPDEQEALDIDTPFDWQVAEALCQQETGA